MDGKNNKQGEEVSSEGKNEEGLEILYNYGKGLVKDQNEHYIVLENKAQKLFTIYNVLFVLMYYLSVTYIKKENIGSEIYHHLTVIFVLINFVIGVIGVYYVLRVLEVIPTLKLKLNHKTIKFFEKNNKSKFYERNLEELVEMHQMILKTNQKKKRNLEISYKFLNFYYFGMLMFIILLSFKFFK